MKSFGSKREQHGAKDDEIPCGEENGQQKHKNNNCKNNSKKSESYKKYKICTQAGNHPYAGKQRTIWRQYSG